MKNNLKKLLAISIFSIVMTSCNGAPAQEKNDVFDTNERIITEADGTFLDYCYTTTFKTTDFNEIPQLIDNSLEVLKKKASKYIDVNEKLNDEYNISIPELNTEIFNNCSYTIKPTIVTSVYEAKPFEIRCEFIVKGDAVNLSNLDNVRKYIEEEPYFKLSIFSDSPFLYDENNLPENQMYWRGKLADDINCNMNKEQYKKIVSSIQWRHFTNETNK